MASTPVTLRRHLALEDVMPEINIEELTKPLKDALYVGVGLGVIAFQKGQVRRREIEKQVREQTTDARAQLDERLRLLEGRLAGVEDQFDTVLDQLQDRLPAQAAELVRQARSAAKDARDQLHGRLTAA
jgi:hypothetical protein